MITKTKKRQLSAKANLLKPVILIGQQGLTESVIKEINHALDDHELIKVRFHSKDREQTKEFIATICSQMKADLIKQIGFVAVIYRKNSDLTVS